MMNGNGDDVKKIRHYIDGCFVPSKKRVEREEFLPVTDPATNATIAEVVLGGADDVEAAVKAAQTAFDSDWRLRTIKDRAAILMKFHGLVREHTDTIADLIVAENGKNKTEALADVAKGNETVEFACSLPCLAPGQILQVSGAVTCQERRTPLGVVASIVPFNFPLMVPMWTVPIALVMGNTVVLKPSEKVPMTMQYVARLFEEAGLPNGCFNMVQGQKDVVEAIIAHPQVQAVTFVGSSPVAKLVSHTCRSLSKRCTALGGAKNHLVALADDCDLDGTASDVVVSFAGCAGQRCMAASVLLILAQEGNNNKQALLDKIVAKASSISPGTGPGQMGPVIDHAGYQKIVSYIDQAEADGAQVLLDGRGWKRDVGNWIGPTILLHKSKTDKTMCEEVFGPVLSVYVCQDWQEAIDTENANPFGNAAAIYTTNGGYAEWFLSKFRAAMLGCNIGIPVPREPFSFGGLYGTRSKYGDMDITGDGGMEFFSHRIKVTSKWPLITDAVMPRATSQQQQDRANFAGSM